MATVGLRGPGGHQEGDGDKGTLKGSQRSPKFSWGSSQPPNLPFGLQDAVKIMAKDLVRTRRYVKKFITMRANVQAVSLKIQTLKSNNSMAQAMKGVTKAMATMNRQVGARGPVPKAGVTNSCPGVAVGMSLRP